MKKEKGLTFCRKEMKGRGKATRTSKKYCPDCKLKIRGKNHEQGNHHKTRADGKETKEI